MVLLPAPTASSAVQFLLLLMITSSKTALSSSSVTYRGRFLSIRTGVFGSASFTPPPILHAYCAEEMTSFETSDNAIVCTETASDNADFQSMVECVTTCDVEEGECDGITTGFTNRVREIIEEGPYGNITFSCSGNSVDARFTYVCLACFSVLCTEILQKLTLIESFSWLRMPTGGLGRWRL